MDFERLINPRVCAMIGASNNPSSGSYRFLEGWVANKFKGRIYPINPKYSEIFGLKTYPDIRDIPDEVDYVLIAIPAKYVPAEVQKCVEKEVKFIVIFTSGFREIGNKDLEAEILEILKKTKSKTRILGPNCIGVYSAEAHLSYFKDQPIVSPEGNVSLITQSGGIARKFLWTSISRGFKVRATVSIGNTIDVSIHELLEYFGKDPKTNIIAAYLEGINQGYEFFSLLKQISPKKPVVILKCGRTSKGSIAVHSHTGAIAGSYEVFSAMLKQAGGISVETFEELTDTILGLENLSNNLPSGKNIAIINVGGGVAVEMTDICESNGFKVANITEETTQNLRELIPDVNTIVNNPIDLGATGFIPEVYGQVIKYLSEDPNIDSLLTVFEVERFAGLCERFDVPDIGESYIKVMEENRNIKKPIISIIPKSWELVDHFITYKNFHNDLLEVGIPSYPTTLRAVLTLKKLIQYNQFLKKLQ